MLFTLILASVHLSFLSLSAVVISFLNAPLSLSLSISCFTYTPHGCLFSPLLMNYLPYWLDHTHRIRRRATRMTTIEMQWLAYRPSTSCLLPERILSRRAHSLWNLPVDSKNKHREKTLLLFVHPMLTIKRMSEFETIVLSFFSFCMQLDSLRFITSQRNSTVHHMLCSPI